MEKGFFIAGISPQHDTTTFGNVVTNAKQTRSRQDQQDSDRKSIYLGDITQGTEQDQVSEEYALAQKKAIKKILDQFDEDSKIDQDMTDEATRIEQLQNNIYSYYDSIDGINQRRESIQNTYNVDPDSQEQKDLELLQKANKHEQNPWNEEYQLTEEEQDRIANIGDLTEYQQDMLLCDTEEQQYREKIEDARKEIEVGKATIYATQKALLKVHPMVDAMKEADVIMDAANKERIGSLYQEGVDQIDQENAETQTEMAENQQKALEEKIEREKLKAEEAKQEEAENEMTNSILSVTLQEMTLGQQTNANLQANVKNLIQDQVLLDVDLKGLRVNKQV